MWPCWRQVLSDRQMLSCWLPLPAGSLQLLEQQVVGGEQAKNKDLKEKHKCRKRYADERRKQLVAALQNSDEDSGDWVLLNVYDSIQEEVRAKSKLLEKVQRKVRPRLQAPTPTCPPLPTAPGGHSCVLCTGTCYVPTVRLALVWKQSL